MTTISFYHVIPKFMELISLKYHNNSRHRTIMIFSSEHTRYKLIHALLLP